MYLFIASVFGKWTMPEKLWPRGAKLIRLYKRAEKRITNTLDEVKMVKNMRTFKELMKNSLLTP